MPSRARDVAARARVARAEPERCSKSSSWMSLLSQPRLRQIEEATFDLALYVIGELAAAALQIPRDLALGATLLGLDQRIVDTTKQAALRHSQGRRSDGGVRGDAGRSDLTGSDIERD